MPQPESQETGSKRYSRVSPPPDEQGALLRLDTLYEATALMATELEFADWESFPDDEEYDLWRDRTIRQLAELRCETTFVERWLFAFRTGGNTYPESPLSSKLRHDDLSIIAEEIRERAYRLAAEIRSSYTPLYGQELQPPDLASAHQRSIELLSYKMRVQAAFAEIAGEWIKYPLDRDDLPGIKAPLQILLTAIEIEMVFVKEYLRARSFDWKSSRGLLCVSALTRAVEQGLVLSSDERAAFDYLREKFITPQPS